MAEGNGFTNKEILVRVEEKVDKILQDHETRIRTLERWRWKVLGAVGAVSAVIGFITPHH